MKLSTTELKDVWIISPTKHGDDRGFFSEVYREDMLVEHGVNLKFIQDNHAYSKEVGVLRGLHFQQDPYAQDKLVRVVKGAIYDVVVDLRKGSPTYGKATSQYIFELSEQKNLGYCKLTVEKFYRVTGASHQKIGVTLDIINHPHLHFYQK